ncbi:hypothetical protein CPB83DRAFT_887328 [Crepidotus variabilis]|uniref:CxC2-like cysteine cluster KDZ transposase-associated domain-containing protein n=1 Tax=Crepidotus variabilis TaxID=179855 RepID=A0A9P6E5E5_9AGAR|nr:hypothetical protein CPB83DRAFT_887328 [Crepidotus variabilis]
MAPGASVPLARFVLVGSCQPSGSTWEGTGCDGGHFRWPPAKAQMVVYYNEVFAMNDISSKRRKFNPPVHHYKDRVVIDDDYEVVSERSSHHYGSQSTRLPAFGATWNIRMSWLPDDNEQLALDEDGSWYDIEMDTGVMESQVRQDQEAVFSNKAQIKQKRVRSETALRPNVVWKKKSRSGYLEELLRWEGRGNFQEEGVCPDCTSRKKATPSLSEYRCRSCFLSDLVCKECCVKRHRQQPFHVVEHRNLLISTYLYYTQMGSTKQMSSIAGVSAQFLATYNFFDGAYTLRVLHMFMLTSKLTVYDAYRALERLTNNIGIRLSNRRYRPLLRMTLQWRHLKMLKRGGRGHQLSGVEGTKEGELAIQCPTCPHPDINLPVDWREAPDGMKFLYMMILCMDANFRLKNQLVSNYSTDPGLGTGWSYMVTRKPYEEYVLSQADEDDISTCVGFQAMSQSVTRFSRGLRYTGVGGVFCARSDMVLPNGVGNLQKGERYANMDMIFASAISSTQLLMIAISYDIVCQWFIHLFNRMSQWPERLRLPENTALRPLIPKFHEPAHNEKDHEQYSCNLAEGVGKCDCEGCERFWAGHNTVGNATKTQGPGSHQDVLDDHFGFWNWEKYAGTERNRQTEAHRGFTESLSTKIVKEWEESCRKWDSDTVPKTVENPYKIEGFHLTETQLRDELKTEENLKSKAKGFKLNSTSPSAFIAVGLDLEISQRRVASIAKEQGNIPANIRTSELKDQRSILRKKILQWEPLRSVYMPGLMQYLAERPDQAVSWDADPNPEDVNLYLPSQIHLEARPHARMVYFKNKNVRGQRGGTQSRDIIDGIHKKALIQVMKYRISRSAKLSLCTEHTWEKALLPLLDRDVRSYADPERKPKQRWRRGIWEDGQQPKISVEEEDEDDNEDDQTEDILGEDPVPSQSKRKKPRKEGTGRTKQTVSWIWINTTIAIDESDAVQKESDILRSEWARSRARVCRSREEVMFLVEEMRRSLVYMENRACWWESLVHIRTDVSPALAEGLAAYSCNQAYVQRELARSFTTLWKTPLEKMEQIGRDQDEEPDDEDPDVIDDDDNVDGNTVDGEEGGTDLMDVDI